MICVVELERGKGEVLLNARVRWEGVDQLPKKRMETPKHFDEFLISSPASGVRMMVI